MTETQPKPGVIPWPPVIYVAAIAISVILGLLYPLPWIGDLLGDVLFAAGWVALFGVAALWFTAIRTMQRFQAREIAFGLGLDHNLIGKATETIFSCYQVFRDYDASMLEINPLVVTRDGNLIALDAKMSFDENALFRRPEISELRDKSQEDPRETFASDRGLSYVGLDGNIGCIINGAGLAMLKLFEQDDETDAVVMIGEIGGPQEAEAAIWARDNMYRYLISRRMSEAAFLLETSDEGIARIAARVGYETAAAFSKLFHRHHGLSPGRYRAARRSDGGRRQEDVLEAEVVD